MTTTDVETLQPITEERARLLLTSFFGSYYGERLMLDLYRTLIGFRRIRFDVQFHLIEPTETYLSRRVRVLLMPCHSRVASTEEYKVAVTKDCWRFSRHLNRQQFCLAQPQLSGFLATRFQRVV